MIGERLEYLNDYGIKLSDNQLENYIKLIEIDNERWWSNDVRSELATSTYYDVFYGAVQNSFSYVNKNSIIKTWSEQINIPIMHNIEENQKNEHKIVINNSKLADSENQSNTYDNFDNVFDIEPELSENMDETLLSEFNSKITLGDMQDNKIAKIIQKEYHDDIYLDEKPLDLNIKATNIILNKDHTAFIENTYLTKKQCLNNIDTLNSQRCTENQHLIDDNKFEKFRLLLFEKKRFRKFNLVKMRHTLFNLKYRPNMETWKIFGQKMFDLGVLSKLEKNYVRFNLSQKSGKFLTYLQVIRTIIKTSHKNNDNEFSSSTVYKNLASSIRPHIIDWDSYFDDLTFDGIIKLRRNTGKIKFFIL